jgi:hypothetical protein
MNQTAIDLKAIAAAYANANAHIGVGDSSTAFSAAHTDLQAASNKLRKAMDATYPQQATNVLTFRSTFGTSEANWAWAEFAALLQQRELGGIGQVDAGFADLAARTAAAARRQVELMDAGQDDPALNRALLEEFGQLWAKAQRYLAP